MFGLSIYNYFDNNKYRLGSARAKIVKNSENKINLKPFFLRVIVNIVIIIPNTTFEPAIKTMIGTKINIATIPRKSLTELKLPLPKNLPAKIKDSGIKMDNKEIEK